ncbi:helix-turn-helix transcriptional regulator [Streptomyces sp. Wh19]|uniref:helix-turn-helix transcriptional regulator n=1 Tax=Streptomyces sp. Wh19 TaxID=3076629 RepID=UPI00295874DD|nr:helix-turn-helix transcriptional regulator [Streptomyces sp. Wh19]MDV9197136.1 helix-turn-helix transcriptional regulator [Streptomyces sp. Wh19]
MTRDAHLDELGEFLKARRSEISPRSAGLPDTGGPRRVPGLRREEMARLVAISTDYCTRLEQGRIQASAPVLSALARVLRLDDDQRDYLFGLAGRTPTRPRRRTRQKIQPQLQRLLDDLAVTPAIVLGRRMDILAWNSFAAALVTDFSKVPEKHRNHIRLVFTDPAMRTLYADGETVARTCTAQLRMEAAKYPDGPRLTALVGELSVQDPQFRRWWGAHHVTSRSVGTKELHHPVAGTLRLDWDTLTASTDPDQQLIVWTAEPGTPSYEGLRLLASWSAGPRQPAPGTTG